MRIADWDDWGYCKPCNRLVAVDEDGVLRHHLIGAMGMAQQCDGVGHKEYELPEEK